jgi:hypothetical protein
MLSQSSPVGQKAIHQQWVLVYFFYCFIGLSSQTIYIQILASRNFMGSPKPSQRESDPGESYQQWKATIDTCHFCLPILGQSKSSGSAWLSGGGEVHSFPPSRRDRKLLLWCLQGRESIWKEFGTLDPWLGYLNWPDPLRSLRLFLTPGGLPLGIWFSHLEREPKHMCSRTQESKLRGQL